MRGTAALLIALLVLVLASLTQAQGTPPATPLTLLSAQGRRPIPTTLLNNQELVALDDVAALFQVTAKDDALAGGITITYRGRTIVASPDQPMASVNGRLVSLPAPALRSGRRWLVPVEFIPRALGPIYDARLDLRKDARLLIMGDLRVPKVSGRVESPGPPTRAVVDISPATSVNVAIEPGRVQLRIDADALDLALPPGGAGLVEQMRAGDQPTVVTILLSSLAGTPRVVPSSGGGVMRVSIDVPPVGQTDAPLSSTASATGPAPAGPAPEAPVTLSSPRPAFQTIVLDPGHGGSDAGAKGPGGVLEKQISLEVVRRLRGLIEARLGLRVVQTRDDDRIVTLDERAAIANNNKADLFISLHTNAALAAAIKGAEVFHLRLEREGEDALRNAVAQEVTLPVLGGGTRPIEVIRWDLAQARHVDQSATLAGILEEELRKRVPISARSAQGAPMRVLSGVDMPAALIEMGYLTNGDQERRLQSAEFQTTLSQAVFDAVVRFKALLDERPSQ